MGQLDCNDKAVESIYTISKEYFVTHGYGKKYSKHCTGFYKYIQKEQKTPISEVSNKTPISTTFIFILIYRKI